MPTAGPTAGSISPSAAAVTPCRAGTTVSGALRAGTKHVIGAHCTGQNSTSIGIENEGTYTSASPPAALYNKLVFLCAYICDQYDIHSNRIYGHRDFLATQCPGDKLYAMLPKLRDDVHDLRVSD